MDYSCRETIIQNMKDCCCEQECIDAFLECFDCNDKAGEERILEDCRRKMLKELHQKQKEIDLLDYMVYQLAHCECKEK